MPDQAPLNNALAMPQVRPDPFIKDGKAEAVRLPDGKVVLRQKFKNGCVQDTAVFPGDYPDAPKVKG